LYILSLKDECLGNLDNWSAPDELSPPVIENFEAGLVSFCEVEAEQTADLNVIFGEVIFESFY
jgi:hypothetical protein